MGPERYEASRSMLLKALKRCVLVVDKRAREARLRMEQPGCKADATTACGLKSRLTLLVHAALRAGGLQCCKAEATSVCGLKLIVYVGLSY